MHDEMFKLQDMQGPLSGLRIIELAGVGPGPFAAMMLADHGAEIVRIDRDEGLAIPDDPIERGRTRLKLDLRDEADRNLFLELVADADALIDPFRPGRLEALGVGPDVLHDRNPKLVIGRITGWGQSGPLSQKAGHDINYLALSGMLASIGPRDRPSVPVNFLADYGGGAMMLLFGMLAALLEVRGGAARGRIVDAAMCEGASLIGTIVHALAAIGAWSRDREDNLLDGGMALYRPYRCSDGRFIAVGALEPGFARQFLGTLGLEDNALFDDPMARECWNEQAEVLAERFAAEPSSHWLAAFENKDACVTPVLGPAEAPRHPHHAERGSFVNSGGRTIPAPTPRYGEAALPPARDGDARHLLEGLGLERDRIEEILRR